MCFLRTFDPRVVFFYPLPLCYDHQQQQSLLSNSQLIEPFLPLTWLDLEGATCLLISAVAYWGCYWLQISLCTLSPSVLKNFFLHIEHSTFLHSPGTSSGSSIFTRFPLCVISLEKQRKPKVFWRCGITIIHSLEEHFEMYTLYRNPCENIKFWHFHMSLFFQTKDHLLFKKKLSSL